MNLHFHGFTVLSVAFFATYTLWASKSIPRDGGDRKYRISCSISPVSRMKEHRLRWPTHFRRRRLGIQNEICRLKGGVDVLPDRDNLVRQFGNYTWTQEEEQAQLYVQISETTKGKHIQVRTTEDVISVWMHNDLLLNETLENKIIPKKTFWEIEQFRGQRCLKVILEKKHPNNQVFDWQFMFSSEHRLQDTSITHQVVFDIQFGDEDIGQVVIGLFGKMCPREVENFIALANNNVLIPPSHYNPWGRRMKKKGGLERPEPPLSMWRRGGYENCSFYKMDFLTIFAGDVHLDKGISGFTKFGRDYEFKQAIMKMEDPWLVAMQVFMGRMDSRFFFTGRRPIDWISGRHVVIGRILSGQTTLRNLYDQGDPAEECWEKRAFIRRSREILPQHPNWIQDPTSLDAPSMMETLRLQHLHETKQKIDDMSKNGEYMFNYPYTTKMLADVFDSVGNSSGHD
eukprot:jgi/Bigna1/85376/estExt_fgenesh1_pg.C_30394